MSAYWNPKPTPKHKPVRISEMKISFSNLRKKERKVTPSDDSWIDSFDPSPMKQRRETTFKEKLDFAMNWENRSPLWYSWFFYHLQKTLMIMKTVHNSLKIIFDICMYYLKLRCMSRQILIDKLSEDNLLNCGEEFLQTLTFSDNDRMNIEKATVRQHKNKTWHKMRHLLVTGKKIKSLYSRQKNLSKKSPYWYITHCTKFYWPKRISRKPSVPWSHRIWYKRRRWCKILLFKSQWKTALFIWVWRAWSHHK